MILISLSTSLNNKYILLQHLLNQMSYFLSLSPFRKLYYSRVIDEIQLSSKSLHYSVLLANETQMLQAKHQTLNKRNSMLYSDQHCLKNI